MFAAIRISLPSLVVWYWRGTVIQPIPVFLYSCTDEATHSILQVSSQPHIGSDHLRRICARLPGLLDEKFPPSVRGVQSFLGAGSLSLLRSEKSMSSQLLVTVVTHQPFCSLPANWCQKISSDLDLDVSRNILYPVFYIYGYFISVTFDFGLLQHLEWPWGLQTTFWLWMVPLLLCREISRTGPMSVSIYELTYIVTKFFRW